MPVHERKVTALIGPSGCGKSTFLRCFNRMHDLYPGNRYEGEIVLQPDNTNLLGARRRPDRSAHAHRHGVPEAQPVPEDDLRERRLRPARARRELAPAHRGEGRAGAAGRGAVGRGQGPAAPAGVQSLRRPAAAPVHRPRARDRPGDAAVRRADLGARPDRHGLDRGADARPQGAGDDPDRHAQHAAGGARLRLHRLHVPRRADRVRRDRRAVHQAEDEADRGLHHRKIRLW